MEGLSFHVATAFCDRGMMLDPSGVEVNSGFSPPPPVLLLLPESRQPELFQMSGSPFTKSKDGKVRDRSGTVIDLFPDVRSILLAIHREERFGNTRLAIASRTEHST